MMLQWLSRCKVIQAQIVRSTQRYSSSTPSNDDQSDRPLNKATDLYKEEYRAEAKAVQDAIKKKTDNKRTVILEEEKEPSTYDILTKKYIEHSINRYDSQAVNNHLLLDETPIHRAIRHIKNDFTLKGLKRFFTPENLANYGTSDFLIVGSGISASLLAYFLKSSLPQLQITVLEEDPVIGCEPLGINGESLIMQWNMPHYIKMANFAFNFYHSLPDLVRKDVKDANLKFTPYGSLFLSTSSEDVSGRCAAYNEIKWKYERLDSKQLHATFPWLNLDGVEGGVHGLSAEGWIDPWATLAYSRRLAMSSGVHYLKGEISSVVFNQHPGVNTEDRDFGTVDAPRIAVIKYGEQFETVDFSCIVLASGVRNRFNSRKLHIGNGPGYLQMPLPLKVRKRYMFRLCCIDAPLVDFPLIMDPSGFRIRREGYSGRYLCWREPTNEEESDFNNLDVDMEYFEEKIRQPLVKRIPAFEKAEVEASWAGFVDVNEFDGEPIIGLHPSYGNVYFVTGLGVNELIFSPAIAQASAEILLESEYKTLDCSAFLLDRILFNDPIKKNTSMRF